MLLDRIVDSKDEVSRSLAPTIDKQMCISETNMGESKTIQTSEKITELPILHGQRSAGAEQKGPRSNNAVAIRQPHSEYKVYIYICTCLLFMIKIVYNLFNLIIL